MLQDLAFRLLLYIRAVPSFRNISFTLIYLSTFHAVTLTYCIQPRSLQWLDSQTYVGTVLPLPLNTEHDA